MAVHNTPSDASNTAVRAYLTMLGARHLGHGFNVSSGKGKQIWTEIKDSFDHQCAFCGESTLKLTMDHLVSFNRTSGGLHHPGNVVPCCSGCNSRKKQDGQEVDWESHLFAVTEREGHSPEERDRRRQRILTHIEVYQYPLLTEDEIAAITTISNSVYESVSEEVKRGAELYWAIHKALIGKSNNQKKPEA
jgi:HNH endonuclease